MMVALLTRFANICTFKLISELKQCCVHLYCVDGLYDEAVSLALSVCNLIFLNLASLLIYLMSLNGCSHKLPRQFRKGFSERGLPVQEYFFRC